MCSFLKCGYDLPSHLFTLELPSCCVLPITLLNIHNPPPPPYPPPPPFPAPSSPDLLSPYLFYFSSLHCSALPPSPPPLSLLPLLHPTRYEHSTVKRVPATIFFSSCIHRCAALSNRLTHTLRITLHTSAGTYSAVMGATSSSTCSACTAAGTFVSKIPLIGVHKAINCPILCSQAERSLHASLPPSSSRQPTAHPLPVPLSRGLLSSGLFGSNGMPCR